MIKSYSKDNISPPYLSVGRNYFLSWIKFYISQIIDINFCNELKLEILRKIPNFESPILLVVLSQSRRLNIS